MRLFRRKERPRAEEYTPESRPGWGLSFRLFAPESSVDWAARAGAIHTNAVVSIGLNFIQRNWPSAKLQVCVPGPEGLEPVESHPFLDAVARPNDDQDTSGLMDATVLSLVCAGNAYWLTLPRKDGSPAFFYLNHERVRPVSSASALIDHYEYRRLGDGNVQRFAPEDVLHFRVGTDPERQALGLSPLAALVREIAQDNMAATRNAAVMNRLGQPGMVISPKEGAANVSEEARRRFREDVQSVFTADGTGRALVLPFQAEIHQPTVSADALMADSMQSVPTSRILAAMGLSAMALDLDSDNKTYSNYGEAVKSAWDNCVVPLQDRAAAALTRFVREWYGQPEAVVRFDRSDVAALQDDKSQEWKRISDAYKAGWITRAQALTDAGLPSTPEDDVYLTDLLGTPADKVKAQQAAAKAARDRLERGEWGES